MTAPFAIRNSAFNIRLVPPKGYASFAWVQHFIHHLTPHGMVGFVLANPPFKDSDWFRKDDDVSWQFGVQPKGNANPHWPSAT